MEMELHELSEEQRLMRQTCRAFVDNIVSPFIRENWQLEWDMTPEHRLPIGILAAADKVGIRTLGVPEEYGGVQLDPQTEGTITVRYLVRPSLTGKISPVFQH